MGASQWDSLLEAQRLIQRHFPDLVMVGGSAVILHAGHRLSMDADHVMVDLRSQFPEILKRLEQIAGWQTNRRQPPVLILGNFQGVPTGIRQFRRTQPLETEEICGIRIPTLSEMARIKGWMIVTRNAVRDYINFCALSEKLGHDFVAAVAPMDDLYPQTEGETTLRQLSKQLAEPAPYDLDQHMQSLSSLVQLQQPWNDWEYVASCCFRLSAQIVIKMLLG
ncbi:MAG TPA: hypothetical protein VMW83_17120 [Spirochaetia bacterium]|nr:hypothetical protein [Spirochaetia bacterium]